ncbi:MULTISPECIES: 2-amino-4-hydroxy-6-hydroxymethyldihydropteridine diphosphokinase [unclassified Roseitalea]|uniref:2-amino-4-hydroxy-6- hydroxymethyldihydropteridine diphosphokinase n=1 Tax=unclassified Roseitalea TaxID=2639107 RepID=UPI00273DC108|nr:MULTISPECIES: 2-amino-4-hydroxy-6-hydroxymethyldihydropteridine diphosphokinase [unclassified Roseitalea]
MMREPVRVLVGLGGNVGDVPATMQAALDALDDRADCTVAAVSPVYSTPPWGITDQARFLNACAALETRLTPHALMDVVLQIERGAGRERTERWGPRTLDIDILVYGALTVTTDRLTIPHPRMFDRGFVLVPLADIAGDRVIAGHRIGDAADRIDRTGIVRTQHRLEVPRAS